MSNVIGFWTDERVRLLEKYWRDGLSATEIAKKLGHGATRNAVIGKVHRLGITRFPPSHPVFAVRR